MLPSRLCAQARTARGTPSHDRRGRKTRDSSVRGHVLSHLTAICRGIVRSTSRSVSPDCKNRTDRAAARVQTDTCADYLRRPDPTQDTPHEPLEHPTAAAATAQSEVRAVGRICAVGAAQAIWGTCASTSCTRADAGSWLCAHRVCREEPNGAKSARCRGTAQVATPPSTLAGLRDQTDTAVAAASMPGDQPINLSFRLLPLAWRRSWSRPVIAPRCR